MKPFKYKVGNRLTLMNNKQNINNVVMATVKTINQNKYMITSVLTAGIVLLAIAQVIKANALTDLKDFIPYSELNNTIQNENYIGFHMVDLHLFVWYHNNHVNGFTVDTVNNEQQQKELDAQ